MTTKTSQPERARRRLDRRPLSPTSTAAVIPDPRRVRSERRGRLAEWLAASLLMARGYRILARRWRSPQGEIDLVAVRGLRITFVEVKQRADATGAIDAIANRQCRRLHNAADAWIARHRRYRDHVRGFDAIFIAPRHWPVLAHDHLQPTIGACY